MEAETKTDIRDVLAARGARHGDFTEHARITQNLKAMARNSVNLKEARLSSVETEAVEMILHKIGRILAGDPHYRDHWDDIAGYATLAADRTPQIEPPVAVAAAIAVSPARKAQPKKRARR